MARMGSANLKTRFQAVEKFGSDAGQGTVTPVLCPAVHVTFRSRWTNPSSSRRNSGAADGTTISKYRSHRAK